MGVKICIKCNQKKPYSEFHKRADSKDGYKNTCKNCCYESRKKLYLDNIEREKENRKKYREKNSESIKKQKKEYYQKNKEYFDAKNKEYSMTHRKELNEYAKEYRAKHQKEITAKRKEKRHNDKEYYFEIYFRNKINNYLYRHGKIKKKNNVKEILGCNFEEFKKHIEKQFKEGMNWENRGEWHLDHIIPLATAKNYEELIKLNHYTNFQPLWAIENLKKGKMIGGKY